MSLMKNANIQLRIMGTRIYSGTTAAECHFGDNKGEEWSFNGGGIQCSGINLSTMLCRLCRDYDRNLNLRLNDHKPPYLV